MKNFKEIAEKCLAGELSGRFVCRDGLHISSFTLSRTDNPLYPYKLYRAGKLTKNGLAPNKYSQNDIIQFIPYEEMKPEQIKIDIPEGKVPVVEQTEKGVVITWKEKELTYKDIENKIILKNTHDCIIGYTPVIEDIKTFNCTHSDFYKKVEVLRKLTNIRNYFGKRTTNIGYVIAMEFGEIIVIEIKTPLCFSGDVIFAKKEHAEQAIKMLGDELKYLFEPW
jgi:hypothetical protein